MTLHTDLLKTTIKSIIVLAVTGIILRLIQFILGYDEKVSDTHGFNKIQEEVHNDARP